ncbi:unnamed protein product [Didymodactylos carnosus]|uniref:HSF-type DNA-binding domain-containing protein n=1 Tax=Didymodactylos carnosus TaxID=1234261 RepID=A0A813T474_9BILA|nr:unnamed protein product [Didymodactylos carnosus]CAF3589090.1 unnamed protein product [Didymodactylos carnosus]
MSSGNYGHQQSVSGVVSQQTPVPAFLNKLWTLVNDSTCDDLIAWDPSGGSFHVYDQARFSREILPRYFKHNNFASFIRQLNMYGFRKISNIEHGSLKSERDDIEFAHPNFIRGQDTLLELIKRRAPENQQKQQQTSQLSSSLSALTQSSYIDPKSNRPVEFVHVLEDVRTLQNKQTSLNEKLHHMQNENEALWREIGSLRQKHSKQQQIVSKLMEFLLHFVSNTQHDQGQVIGPGQANLIQHHPQEPQSVNEQQQNMSTQNLLQNSSNLENGNSDSVMHSNTGNGTNGGLKRKPLMIGDIGIEPKHAKRSSVQQQQEQAQQQRGMHQQYHQHQQPQSHRSIQHATRLVPNISIHTNDPNLNSLHQQHPLNIGRQQSVTINEISANDQANWLHGTTSSPLVDLVPSPPPQMHSGDGNTGGFMVDETSGHHFHNDDDDSQHPRNDYWMNSDDAIDFGPTTTTATRNDHRQNNNKYSNRSSIGNVVDSGTFMPDFFLRSDNETNQTTSNDQHTSFTNNTTTAPTTTTLMMTPMKQEQLDFVDQFQLATPDTMPLSMNPMVNYQQQQKQQQDIKQQNIPKVGQQQLTVRNNNGDIKSFSLDDFNNDVDGIQVALDSIRDLIYSNLPDGTRIEDLFDVDEGVLLSPTINQQDIQHALMAAAVQTQTGSNTAETTKITNINTTQPLDQTKPNTVTFVSLPQEQQSTFPTVVTLGDGGTNSKQQDVVLTNSIPPTTVDLSLLQSNDERNWTPSTGAMSQRRKRAQPQQRTQQVPVQQQPLPIVKPITQTSSPPTIVLQTTKPSSISTPTVTQIKHTPIIHLPTALINKQPPTIKIQQIPIITPSIHVEQQKNTSSPVMVLQTSPQQASNTSESLVNNERQLLDQLLSESVKAEEQRHTIEKLEREKSNLQEKVNRFEQQQQGTNNSPQDNNNISMFK